ncbi:MAG: hydrogenase [Nitrospirae bacterium]|nr:MAG: formate hydrogenlyase subunit 7 [Leptospirillum sp. Group IV 'UBA BS']MCL4485858.1 hydrogenase [Nitrospirota bacterium]MCL5285287.1 hydrogenase [Nitrospirota bacterium]
MWKLLRKIFRTGILTEKKDGPRSPTSPPGFEKSLAIRHVDAGSCNGCELELTALENPYYALSARGVKFVPSPRHADVLLVTGPVTLAMKEALLRSHDAVPCPKKVLAVGDCALNGGIFRDSYAVLGGVDSVVPVDLHLPGCPPSPDDLLEALERIFRSPLHAPE